MVAGGTTISFLGRGPGRLVGGFSSVRLQCPARGWHRERFTPFGEVLSFPPGWAVPSGFLRVAAARAGSRRGGTREVVFGKGRPLERAAPGAQGGPAGRTGSGVLRLKRHSGRREGGGEALSRDSL